MSGHYLLMAINRMEISDALNGPLKAKFSPRFHAEVGWTYEAQKTLDMAKSGEDIKNRNLLPPHHYLFLEKGDPDSWEKKSAIITSMQWIPRLQRPPKMGLKSLCAKAQMEWDAGKIAKSVIEQAAESRATIEIYYIAGHRA